MEGSDRDSMNRAWHKIGARLRAEMDARDFIKDINESQTVDKKYIMDFKLEYLKEFSERILT